MESADWVNGKAADDMKFSLIKGLFLFRAEYNLDDTQLIQSIINDGYISEDEIIKGRRNFRGITTYVSPFYTNIIGAIARKAVTDSSLEDLLIDYFFNIYLPKATQKEKAPVLLRDFKRGMLSEDKACFAAYFTLLAQSNNYYILSQLKQDCIEQGLIYRFENVEQRTVIKDISALLEYDVAKNGKLMDRFRKRRFTELFSFVCKISGANPLGYTDEEAATIICMAATGICTERIINQKLKKYDNRLFRSTLDDKSKELDVSFLGPLNKVGNNAPTNLLAYKLRADFGQNGMVKDIIEEFFLQANNTEFVYHSIQEYLLDVLSDAYYSSKKQKLTIEQIVRFLPYSEMDCRIVLEKVSSFVYSTFLINQLFVMTNNSIVFGDYTNIKKATYSDIAKRNNNSDNKQKNIQSKTKNVVSSIRSKLDKERIKSEQLEKENKQLREQLLALQTQINRKEGANSVIAELREQVEILNDENSALNDRIEFLRNKESVGSGVEEKAEDEQVIDDAFFHNKKVIIVGGRWEINRKLEEIMPKAKFVYQPTEPMLNVTHYECIIFFTEFLSHTLYGKYITQCRNHNTPMLYLKGSSIDNIKREIFHFFEEMSSKV